jgi:hypothetical protein
MSPRCPFVLALILAARCAGTLAAEPAKEDPKWGPEAEGVSARLLLPTTAAPGEAVTAVVELKRVKPDAKIPERPMLGVRWLPPTGKEGGAGALLEKYEISIDDKAKVGDVAAKITVQLPGPWPSEINAVWGIRCDVTVKNVGSEPINASTNTAPFEVHVPADKVLDFYINELLAEHPLRVPFQFGDIVLPTYPVPELMAIGKPAASRLAEICQNAKTPRDRQRAANTLGYFQAQGGVAAPALAKALSDPDDKVQHEAMNSIVMLGEAALPQIGTIMEFVAKGVTPAAGLGRLGPKVVPELEKALTNDNARLSALGALETLGAQAKDAAAAIRPYLADKQPINQVFAARALWSVARDPAALPVLAKNLRDGDYGVRYNTADGLGIAGPAAIKQLPALQAALAAEKSDALQIQMRQAISQIRPKPNGGKK